MEYDFFLEPPVLTEKGQLTITALAPLSMVSKQPGTYFRSELAPTEGMLYGMLENALGWHFGADQRRALLKGLKKLAKKKHRKKEEFADHSWLNDKPRSTDSGYLSLLQYHLEFKSLTTPETRFSYDDLWSMHLRDSGRSFFGGSRQYAAILEKLITATRDENAPVKISFGDRSSNVRLPLEEVLRLEEASPHYDSVRSLFPQYYVSPKKRGYVFPDGHYEYEIETTNTLSDLLKDALEHPEAPLYLGSNDGWVDVKWTSS